MKARQTQRLLQRRPLLALAAMAASVAAGKHPAAQAPTREDPWPSLAAQIFDGRAIEDGSSIVAIDAPYRAEDAALVPVGLRSLLPLDDVRRIVSIALVIDENPSPVAAVFSLGVSSGVRSLSTRVRVDSYTNLHAVAELSDGLLYGTQRFIKAAGGCSAPAAKQGADSIPLGTMRFRRFQPASGTDPDQPDQGEAQLLIRHPNYSGMQMDQVTRLYVPAHFVKSVRIWQGQNVLLSIDCGISISENPSFRFDFRSNGANTFKAEMVDSDGGSFGQEWPATPS
jgi:sulfur-oxidizing protein SoxY